MQTRPKSFTLNRDIYFGRPRKAGDVVTGFVLGRLLERMPHVLDQTKPTKKESEVG